MKRASELSDDELNLLISESFDLVTKSTICKICKGNYSYEAGDDYGITIWETCKHCDQGSVPEYYIGIVNYCQCLNAMHEAEKSLENSQVFDYMKNLVAIKKHPISEMGQLHTYLFHATARQRAEAYVITKGLAKA